MPYQPRPDTGSLFQNRDHTKNAKAPNLKGSLLVEIGDQLIELDLAGWTKESDKVGKCISLSVKLKSVRPSTHQPIDNSDLDRALGEGRGDDEQL